MLSRYIRCLVDYRMIDVRACGERRAGQRPMCEAGTCSNLEWVQGESHENAEGVEDHGTD